MTANFITENSDETKQIGQAIGRLLASGDIVLLFGELGTGKTCLTQGIADGIGIDEGQHVTSPSYILINVYTGKIPIYHIDLYRIQDPDALYELGLAEYLYGEGVCVVEWADRMTNLPKDYLKIVLEWIDLERRRFQVSSVGNGYDKIVSKLSEIVEKTQFLS